MQEVTNNQSGNRRIAKNTIILYGRMIVVLLVSLYSTRVVLNVLGVSDYGIYNVVAGFVSMFAFLNSAMINTTQRYLNYEKGKGNIGALRSIFNTSCQIQLMIGLLTLTLLEIFGVWYLNNVMIIPENRLYVANWLFQFSAFSLIVLIIQIPYSAIIICHERMDYYAFVSVAEVIFKLIIIIVLPYVGCDKLFIYGLLLFILSVINFLLYYIYSTHHFQETKLFLKFDSVQFKKMVSFSGWNMFNAIAYTIQGQGLNMLINSFFGPVINAARAIAFQIHAAISGFSENIATAFRPQLVESYAKKDFKRTEELMNSMSKYCYMMIFILSLPIIIEIDSILNLWLDGTIPEYTTTFSILVLINLMISSLNLPVTQTALATGCVKYYQIIRSILVTSVLPISWLFLRLGYKPQIVFLITLLISVINQPISLILLHSSFPFSYRLYQQNVIKPCLFLTLFSPFIPIVAHLLMSESIARVIVVVLISVLWSCLIAFFFVLTHQEQDIIKHWIANRKSK